MGVVIAIGDRSCLTTKASLAAESKVHLVDPMAQQLLDAAIVSRDDGCLTGTGPEPGLRGYAIRFQTDAPRMPVFGIAIVDASPIFRRSDGSVVSDIDGDGHDEFFRSCTSTEGVHFTVWSDRPQGRRRWHRYYPLGYDVTPSCTPAETEVP